MRFELLMLLDSLENSSRVLTFTKLISWHDCFRVQGVGFFFLLFSFRKNMVYAKLAESPACSLQEWLEQTLYPVMLYPRVTEPGAKGNFTVYN